MYHIGPWNLYFLMQFIYLISDTGSLSIKICIFSTKFQSANIISIPIFRQKSAPQIGILTPSSRLKYKKADVHYRKTQKQYETI